MVEIGTWEIVGWVEAQLRACGSFETELKFVKTGVHGADWTSSV